MPSIRRRVFGLIRQFSSATSNTIPEFAGSQEEDVEEQSFISLYLAGKLKKEGVPEVYSGKTGVDLPILLIDRLKTDVFASHTGPEGGITQVPPIRKKPISNIARLDDELNISFDTESCDEEDLESDADVLGRPNNNYVSNRASRSSGLADLGLSHTEIDNFASLYDGWSMPHPYACGISTSLYECHPITNVHAGEPIADVFGVCARENNAVLILGDGVNWGDRSRLAARCAVRGAMEYLCEHLYHPDKPVKNTLEIFHCLLQAFHTGHQLILQEGGTLTTLCVVVIVPLRGGSDYVACACNVGDSLAFVYNENTGVREITLASHDIQQMRDMRDAGGALGPVDGINPELHNFTCSMTVVSPGDIVFITSDGISDNFDPVVGKFCVIKEELEREKENVHATKLIQQQSSLPKKQAIPNSPATARRAKKYSTRQPSSLEDDDAQFNTLSLPVVQAHQRHELMLLRMQDLLQNGVTVGDPAIHTADDLCQNLVNFANQLTMAKRRILEDHDLYQGESGKLRRDDQRARRRQVRSKLVEMPGKLDHASVVACTVGAFRDSGHRGSSFSLPRPAALSLAPTNAVAASLQSPSAVLDECTANVVQTMQQSTSYVFSSFASSPTSSESPFKQSRLDSEVVEPGVCDESSFDSEETPRPSRRLVNEDQIKSEATGSSDDAVTTAATSFRSEPPTPTAPYPEEEDDEMKDLTTTVGSTLLSSAALLDTVQKMIDSSSASGSSVPNSLTASTVGSEMHSSTGGDQEATLEAEKMDMSEHFDENYCGERSDANADYNKVLSPALARARNDLGTIAEVSSSIENVANFTSPRLVHRPSGLSSSINGCNEPMQQKTNEQPEALVDANANAVMNPPKSTQEATHSSDAPHSAASQAKYDLLCNSNKNEIDMVGVTSRRSMLNESYYGATLEGLITTDVPLLETKAATLPKQQAPAKQQASSGGRLTKQFKKFEHLLKSNESVKTASAAGSSNGGDEPSVVVTARSSKKKHPRTSPHRHTVHVDFGFLQKLRGTIHNSGSRNAANPVVISPTSEAPTVSARNLRQKRFSGSHSNASSEDEVHERSLPQQPLLDATAGHVTAPAPQAAAMKSPRRVLNPLHWAPATSIRKSLGAFGGIRGSGRSTAVAGSGSAVAADDQANRKESRVTAASLRTAATSRTNAAVSPAGSTVVSPSRSMMPAAAPPKTDYTSDSGLPPKTPRRHEKATTPAPQQTSSIVLPDRNIPTDSVVNGEVNQKPSSIANNWLTLTKAAQQRFRPQDFFIRQKSFDVDLLRHRAAASAASSKQTKATPPGKNNGQGRPSSQSATASSNYSVGSSAASEGKPVAVSLVGETSRSSSTATEKSDPSNARNGFGRAIFVTSPTHSLGSNSGRSSARTPCDGEEAGRQARSRRIPHSASDTHILTVASLSKLESTV